MDVLVEANRLHGSGFNCAQSVLAALRDYTGLEDKTALALAGGFGGGVRCGEICGAVSGAVMAIGMANPYNDGADLAAKDKIARLTDQCTKAFREKFGCIRCADLKKNGHPCPELIAAAAQLAEGLITQE